MPGMPHWRLSTIVTGFPPKGISRDFRGCAGVIRWPDSKYCRALRDRLQRRTIAPYPNFPLCVNSVNSVSFNLNINYYIMKLFFTSLFTTALLASSLLQGSITTFTGTPNTNITNEPSWDNGLPLIADGKVGTININGNFSGVIAGWAVNHTGGTLTSSSNRTLGAVDADTSGTIWNLNGGSLDFGTANINRGTVGSNYAYVLNVNSGSIVAGSLQNTAGTTVNLNGGTITLSATWSMANGIFNMTSGSVSAAALATNGDSRINFFTGSTATLTVTGLGLSDYETLWTQTRLRFDGGNAGSFADHFVVNGSTLTVVPEPSTYAALLGLLALGFVAWRRRGLKR